MARPILSSRTIASLQTIQDRAWAQDGLTIGGASWQKETVSGGKTSASSTTLDTAYEGYTEEMGKTREAQTQAGPYYDAPYTHTVKAEDGPTLAPGNIIRGTGVRMRIIGPIASALYPGRVYACEQVQGV
jgi:hypothetical protein